MDIFKYKVESLREYLIFLINLIFFVEIRKIIWPYLHECYHYFSDAIL